MLAGAVLLGWVIDLLTEIPEVAIAVLVAFLAGGVVLNVLKEELPEERESRFWAFARRRSVRGAPAGAVTRSSGRKSAGGPAPEKSVSCVSLPAA